MIGDQAPPEWGRLEWFEMDELPFRCRLGIVPNQPSLFFDNWSADAAAYVLPGGRSLRRWIINTTQGFQLRFAFDSGLRWAGYAKVVDAVDVPVAAGEHEYTRWQFRDLIERANPAVLQPDLVKCAGISEAVKIAALASAHHKLPVPRQTQPTIGQAANLHDASVFVAGETAQELSHGWGSNWTKANSRRWRRSTTKPNG
jgi:hypothetical protein